MSKNKNRIEELIEKSNDNKRMQKICKLAREDEKRKVDNEWLDAVKKHFEEYLPDFKEAVDMIEKEKGLPNPDELMKYIKEQMEKE